MERLNSLVSYISDWDSFRAMYKNICIYGNVTVKHPIQPSYINKNIFKNEWNTKGKELSPYQK
jgi:hypothetical protein